MTSLSNYLFSEAQREIKYYQDRFQNHFITTKFVCSVMITQASGNSAVTPLIKVTKI